MHSGRACKVRDWPVVFVLKTLCKRALNANDMRNRLLVYTLCVCTYAWPLSRMTGQACAHEVGAIGAWDSPLNPGSRGCDCAHESSRFEDNMDHYRSQIIKWTG